jgi:choline dehydrogenase-like flavoprotein/pimeloyl-ACP methyl ester carboxylesterase
MQAGAQTGARKKGGTAWLSRGFEELLYYLEKRGSSETFVFDVIIVGSGYGGAIAAAELAGSTMRTESTRGERKLRVCVLERGKEYLSGMFPAGLADLPAHVRYSTAGSPRPGGRREGLFDVRVGEDLSAIVANGLGGGSLINAGVMERPHPAVFHSWPHAVRDDLFRTYFDTAESLLGVHGNSIKLSPRPRPLKTQALEALARASFREASITVALTDQRNGEGVSLKECKLCGDCATGCNHGAKNSLDVNLLAKARRAGAHVFTGVTVLRIERAGDDLWLLHTVHTDQHLRKRQGPPAVLRARKLILAAGTFGSTEILLRSQCDTLRLSPRLGQRFSANGDAITVVYGQNGDVNAVSDESDPPERRAVGPTITGLLDLRAKDGTGHVIEELAIPGALRRVFEETVTTVKTLHDLEHIDCKPHWPDAPTHDPCAVDAKAIRSSSVLVAMGDDGAAGALELVERREADAGDGAIRIRWPGLRDAELFGAQIKQLQALVAASGAGGQVLPNPLWQLLPASMQFLFDDRRGPPLTVHPLGGCPMGDNADAGVVNHLGQVFDVAADPLGERPFGNLAVLDGSIVRSALGINPALTISALALRAVESLRTQWGFASPRVPVKSLPERTRFREERPGAARRPTEIEVVERMTGAVKLKAKGWGRIPCVVELTLRFAKCSIADLVLPKKDEKDEPAPAGKPVPMQRTLELRGGEMRIFLENEWNAWRARGGSDEDLGKIVQVRAPLAGTLSFFQRECNRLWQRWLATLLPWWLNRGMRDSWQALTERRQRPRSPLGSEAAGLWSRLGWRIKSALALASRAGEVRLLEYRLRLKADATCKASTPIRTEQFVRDSDILGLKRLTYGRRANPWRQLMEMRLKELAGAVHGRPVVLHLDTKYLAAQRVPLFKIVGQQDQVSALADLGSFLGYFLRLLINIHVWSFRRPDAPAAREPQRLPAAVEGRLPEPAITEIEVDRMRDGTPVRVRLTRYRPRNARGRPVVMIHGYSASGTTFAHHAVKPCMAEYFYRRKRDVWILDLRTSSGMPTARHPWTFEDAALADLPVAFDAIYREAQSDSLDVFAHCMGAAMFSMAVLAPPETGERFFRERSLMPRRVHRAVLSQIAPFVVMSPANIFRGYAMSYLRHFLPLANYEFRVRPDPGLVDQLIDRLLATLPYPKEEFDIENPLCPLRRTPFVGTRHRMDALYGRDFSLADRWGRALLNDKVLEYIDDLFGPLSIETVAQAIHFARSETITTRAGRNKYALPANMARNWTFPTMSIHGSENGLSDVATLARFEQKFMEQAGIKVEKHEFREFGHQDSLIGKKARKVFRVVFNFLSEGEDRGRH